MITRYVKPISTRIEYTGPHANLDVDELAKAENKSKLLYNDSNGAIVFRDMTILDDIEAHATMADFPTSGDTSKMYLDESTNKLYRWASSSYFFMPHQVYSKTECDTLYYVKADIYTKTEADTKYTIRSNTDNDMTGSELNNLTAVSVSNCLTANQTAISVLKPLNMGWEDINFVTTINGKIQLDEATPKLLTNLNLNTKDIIGINTTTTTELKTGYFKRPNGTSLITAYDTYSDFHDMIIREVESMEVLNLKYTDDTNMISFISNSTISMNSRSLTNLGIVEINQLKCNNLANSSGTAMIELQADGMNFKNKNLKDVGTIETGGLNYTDSTPMLSLTNNANISMNGKNLNSVGTLNASIINGTTSTITTINGTTLNVPTVNSTTLNATDTNSTNVTGTTLNATDTNSTNVTATTIGTTTLNATTINVNKVQSVITEADYLARNNGTGMITFDSDTRIQFNNKDFWDVGTIETVGLRHTDATDMITLTDNANISMNNKTINSIGSLNTTELKSNLIKRSNGVTMLSFTDDNSIDFGGKGIWNGGHIECSGLRHDDATQMISFPDNATIYANGRDVTGVKIIGVESINVTGPSGINGKIRFDSGTIDIMDNVGMNGKYISGVTTINASGIITASNYVGESYGYGAHGAFWFNGGNMNMSSTGIHMFNNALSGVGDIIANGSGSATISVAGTNIEMHKDIDMKSNDIINLTSINGDTTKTFCRGVKQTFTTAGGSQTHTYNAPGGYRIVSAQWFDNFNALVYDSVITTDSSSSMIIDRSVGLTITIRVILDKDV